MTLFSGSPLSTILRRLSSAPFSCPSLQFCADRGIPSTSAWLGPTTRASDHRPYSCATPTSVPCPCSTVCQYQRLLSLGFLSPHPAAKCHPCVCGHRPEDLQHRCRQDRGQDQRSHQGADARTHSRPARRHAAHHGSGPEARSRRGRGRLPGSRRDVPGQERRHHGRHGLLQPECDQEPLWRRGWTADFRR